MEVCMLEESIFQSVSKMDDNRTSLAKVLHLESFRNRNSAVGDSAADLYLRSKSKLLYGKSVPYYCFNFDVSNDPDNFSQCIEIPAARLLQSLQRMVHTYESDKVSKEESFAHWGERKGSPFFYRITGRYSPDLSG